jgi:DDE superfamily endonuclease/Helix-turn-helix of DDE superfamily endonuclease
VLSYPSTIPVSTRTLTHLTGLLRTERTRLGSRWRRLPPGRQALLVLAHLRNGDTFTRLATGFGIGVATAWRYVHEALTLLAAQAPDLATAMKRISQLAYAILDGTLIPIDRVADEAPYYSGKHRRHGVNVQVVTDAAGRLVWASPALPGRAHDLTAARTHGLIDALTQAQVTTYVDKAYQGAPKPIQPPFRRHRYQAALSDGQHWVNQAHRRTRAHGERANATLKTWRIFTKLRCCPRKATTLIQAVLTLHLAEDQHRYPR